MFGHVCIDEYKQYTRVEKLRNEDAVCNGSEALTVSIMFNGLNEANNQYSQQIIDGNDDERNGKAQSFGHIFVLEVQRAKRLLMFYIINRCRINFILLLYCLIFAEASHNRCVLSILILLFQFFIANEFSKCIIFVFFKVTIISFVNLLTRSSRIS